MNKRKHPFLKLYVQDFLSDERLNLCSASAQGVYIKILCVLHKSDPYGQILLKQKDKQKSSTRLNFACKLAKLLPFGLDVIKPSLDELLDENVLQIDGDVLYQKRMLKDAEISAKRAKAGSKGGRKTASKTDLEDQNFAQANGQAKSQAKGEQKSDIESLSLNSKSKKEKRGSKGRKTKAYNNVILSELPWGSDVFERAWEQWKRHRFDKDGRFPYKTPAQQKSALTKLYKASEGDEILALAMIDQSIDRGWDGFFELKGTHLTAYQKLKGKTKETGREYFMRNAGLIQ